MMLSSRDAAKRVGVTPARLIQKVHDGSATATEVPAGRTKRYLFDETEVDRLAALRGHSLHAVDGDEDVGLAFQLAMCTREIADLRERAARLETELRHSHQRELQLTNAITALLSTQPAAMDARPEDANTSQR